MPAIGLFSFPLVLLQIEAIRRVILERATSLLPGVEGQVVGSYRRGAKHSGDVDFIFTHPQWRAPDHVDTNKALAAAVEVSYQVCLVWSGGSSVLSDIYFLLQ